MKRYRRKEAARALTDNGYPMSVARLAKLIVEGGGPEVVYFGRYPMYPEDRLFAWAEAKLSKPVRSTTERQTLAVA